MSATTTDDRQRPTDGPTPGIEQAPGTEPLDGDAVFHLLQARRRRLVLRYLRGREGPVEMRDVAEQVAAWEHDTTLEALRSEERQRVYIALYQTHLPKLDEAGVIDYEQSRGVVNPTERIERLYEVLDFEGGEGADGAPARDALGRRNRLDYYRGASLASTGLVTAAWTGLIALPGLAVATIVTALFALLAVGAGGHGVTVRG